MINRQLVTVSAAAMAVLIGFAPAAPIPARAEEVTEELTTISGPQVIINGTSNETATPAKISTKKPVKKAKKKPAKKRKVVKTASVKKKRPENKRKVVQSAFVKKNTYKPVNANRLTADYKAKLARQKKNWIAVDRNNYSSRLAREKAALIDITWDELVDLSQVKLTPQGFDLMCRVVQCEAGDVKYVTKEMVAECIVNRAKSYNNSDPVSSALKARGQFAVVRNGRINTWDINGETVNAVKDALIRNSHPSSLKYFRNRHYFSWAKPYRSSDGTYFSLGR